jgi:hypothetical protein
MDSDPPVLTWAQALSRELASTGGRSDVPIELEARSDDSLAVVAKPIWLDSALGMLLERGAQLPEYFQFEQGSLGDISPRSLAMYVVELAILEPDGDISRILPDKNGVRWIAIETRKAL